VHLDANSSVLLEAKSYLARAIKADSNDPLNFGMFAHYWETLGNYDCAEALYLQALTVNPSHIHLLVRYGQFLSHTRELYEVAEAFFNRAKGKRKIVFGWLVPFFLLSSRFDGGAKAKRSQVNNCYFARVNRMVHMKGDQETTLLCAI
jgi:tetratricopeptide (TPR) repeat protein